MHWFDDILLFFYRYILLAKIKKIDLLVVTLDLSNHRRISKILLINIECNY